MLRTSGAFNVKRDVFHCAKDRGVDCSRVSVRLLSLYRNNMMYDAQAGQRRQRTLFKAQLCLRAVPGVCVRQKPTIRSERISCPQFSDWSIYSLLYNFK